MEEKKRGRMATVPQFTVPEIFVDDEDITNAQRSQQSPSGSPLFRATDSSDANWHTSAGSLGSPSPLHLDTNVTPRSRTNSIQNTPQGSPIRTSEGDWQFASALSRPSSPLEPHSDPTSRSRANSAVSAADVLEVLDNSAWGESIRRSFTQRRRS